MFLNKDNLDEYLEKLYNEVVALNRNTSLCVDIYIMGGSAIMLNNRFRESTMDIDAYIRSTLDLSKPIVKVAEKNDLPKDWLNTNVTVTQSFTKRLLPYFKVYKRVSDKFTVYVINNLAQVCMKLVSFRIDSSDVTDIKGIVEEGFDYSYDDVIKAIEKIYGDSDVISVDAQLFIYNLLSNRHSDLSDKARLMRDLADKLLI
ncbi:TPA: hypothetical protein KOR75_001207 [Clostridioides difficile]|nr:hypothetical protein [Clostridioides difficile]